MKIAIGATNIVSNYIFSGVYSLSITGVKGKMYDFSNPSLPLSKFSIPYDAYLPNYSNTGDKVVAAAKRIRAGCQSESSRTGVFYFSNNVQLIGGCHGYGHADLTYYNGFNFYNAFYPIGNFSPPFGENISIFKAGQSEYEALKNGSCANLTVTEYNELFGIVSKTSSDSSLLSSTQTPNIFAPIYSPSEACPPEVASESYYDEFQFTQIPGNTTNLGGNNPYNGNPIPTSLDNFDIKINGRYRIETVGKSQFVIFSNGRPESSYTSTSEINKLNNNLCFANLMETKISQGIGSNGSQLMDAPDAIQGIVGDQTSFVGADPFHYWHFTFEENAERLPFNNNFHLNDSSSPSSVRPRAIGEGTPLFTPILSLEEHYWKNRQCPATVDFLPWTLGASIYACPSAHFDIPYYAALRKFGFYGTRFLNSCKKLNLDYSISGVEFGAEMPQSDDDYLLPDGEIEPLGLDGEGSWSYGSYNNLLKIAKAEERYGNMYALNKGFFIWANSGFIAQTPEYKSLIEDSRFSSFYGSLLNGFQSVFSGGLASFTDNEPNVFIDNSDSSNGIFTVFSSGTYSDVLASNDEYLKFKESIDGYLSQPQLSLWDNIEKKFSFYVSDGNSINESFYQNIVSGREKRLRTRYFENLLRGNAIDLYPLNSIPFALDNAKDYIESPNWGRSETSFGLSSDLPEIGRRYFEGAYGREGSLSGFSAALTGLGDVQTNYYYPGFFQDIRLDKQLPTPSYQRPISGLILDSDGRKFSPSGWLALGYNEIGRLDSNFSCFTPIFIQSPLPKVFCKIGQKPTLRALAVDYHSIPDDKISRRYPEISYWASKLKLTDCNGKNLYPLKYKWFRAKISDYASILSGGGIISQGNPSCNTGEWACFEGDGPECSVFHPLDSFPVFQDNKTESNYSFIKGAVKDSDDQYFYYCMASGRFGVRVSNPSTLNIEEWIRFDISVKNGMNNIGTVAIDFETTSFSGSPRKVSISSEADAPNYAGYQHDTDAVPESVVESKVPPPNAGFGDVKAFRFVGPIGYIGTTRSYSPASLEDTRALRESWGHLLEYGNLLPFSKVLSQDEGDTLYGYGHLPVCNDYQMSNGKNGVKVTTTVNGKKVGHWSLPQQATASLDNKAGIEWDKLFNQGELYQPTNYRYPTDSMGIGHWQWGNNLGAIKRFGKFSTSKSNDITLVGGYGLERAVAKNTYIDQIKTKLIGPSDLAGSNCGYTKYGLGRNMIYYLEAYERFYIICDPLKKKNVTNVSFIAPGVRLTNSALQYFWLGHPSNTYLKRRAMYGPYAFQWRVNRHNRDRNGNGMSEGFYSFGMGQKYSLMYDAPSIYGLYIKKDTSSRYLTLLKNVQDAKDKIKDKYSLAPQSLRRLWFGERGSEGTSSFYGDISFSCDPMGPSFNQDICDYVSAAEALASSVNFSDHACPQDLLADGQCFDPCMSMRYAQGFFPGGKLLDLFGYSENSQKNSKEVKHIKIVPLATIKDNTAVLGDEASSSASILFRSPLGTPHARISKGLKLVDGEISSSPSFIAGVSPCQDGGSEHCNFITPTIHLGLTSYLIGQGNAFSQMVNFNANLYRNDANIRGENL